MTEKAQILGIVNENYPMSFDTIEFVRDSGCFAYNVYENGCKYFLRITKPMFFDTASKSLDIHLFLQKHDFAVPRIIFMKNGSPCVQVSDEEGNYFYVLYEFIEGEEVDPEQDAEEIGSFIGKLHRVMQDYPGELIKNDKYYYIDILILCEPNNMKEQMNLLHMGKACGIESRICHMDIVMGICTGEIY